MQETSVQVAPQGRAHAKKVGWRRWVRPLMLSIALVFVVFTARDLAARWQSGQVRLNAPLALVAFLPVLCGNLLQGVAWIVLVERMAGTRTRRLAALSLFLDSQIVRYAPGKIGLALARMEGAARVGLTPGIVAVSVFIEALSWLGTGSVIGLALLVAFGAPSEGFGALAGPWLGPLLVVALCVGFALVAVDRRRIPPQILKRLALEGSGALVPLRLPLVHALYWLSWLVHGYLVARALGADQAGALRSLGFVPLAAVLGVVAVAAPAGVGVREAALIYGLGPVLGGPAALGLAVLSRVSLLVGDVIAWLGARGILTWVARRS